MIEWIIGGFVFFLVALFILVVFSTIRYWLNALRDKVLGSRDPFECNGCHDHQFDHFCDVLEVTDEEVPRAFAAWLASETDWDGDYGPVED